MFLVGPKWRVWFCFVLNFVFTFVTEVFDTVSFPILRETKWNCTGGDFLKSVILLRPLILFYVLDFCDAIALGSENPAVLIVCKPEWKSKPIGCKMTQKAFFVVYAV